MLGNVTVSLLGKWVRARVVPAACVALPACTEGRIAHTHTHSHTSSSHFILGRVSAPDETTAVLPWDLQPLPGAVC